MLTLKNVYRTAVILTARYASKMLAIRGSRDFPNRANGIRGYRAIFEARGKNLNDVNSSASGRTCQRCTLYKRYFECRLYRRPHNHSATGMVSQAALCFAGTTGKLGDMWGRLWHPLDGH